MKKYEVIIGRTAFERVVIEAKNKDEALDLAWDEEGSGQEQYWDDQAEIAEINEIVL